jgi:hypothetical protein
LKTRAWVAVLSAFVALAADPVPARLSADQRQAASERTAGPTVDFVAVQSDGTSVADLQRSEVAIRVGDRPTAIRSLRRVATAHLRQGYGGQAPPLPYGTNDSVAVGRRFILVVDQESFGAGREPLLRNAVAGLVTQLTQADVTMVAALPFGGVRVPFTNDTARIRRAMDGISGQGSVTETGSELACRTRRFLETLDSFLMEQPVGGPPSTVVVFTAGLAAPRRDAPMARAPGMCELTLQHFRRITLVASATRANFFVLVPADIGMRATAWRATIGGVGDTGSDNPLEGIEHLAGATGAARLPLDGTGTASLLRVARESSAYYEAELEPEPAEVFGRSRAFSVRVLRRDVTVRARPEITIADPARRSPGTRLVVTDLLASTEAFNDLPLRVGGFTVREADGRLRVGVLVEPADPAATLASAGAILIAGDGRVVGRWFAKDATERPLVGAMPAPPGSYRLRVAALDTSGRSGAAEDDVEVGLTSVGPISLGALMLGVSRGDSTRMQLGFGSEPAAIASFDIYGGAPGLRMTATLEVARDSDGPPLAILPLALKRADDARVVAIGAVPLGALKAGDYVVRGIIKLEDGTTGSVTRTLRKAAR